MESYDETLEIFKKIPTNFYWKDLFKVKEPLSFYESVISDINFHIIKKNSSSLLDKSIITMITNNSVQFATFSFSEHNFDRYISIFFDHICLLIELTKENINANLNEILIQLTRQKIFFISPIQNDYEELKKIIIELNEKNKKERQIIDLNNLIFANKKDQENIYLEIQELIEQAGIKNTKNILINLTKYSIATYMIRSKHSANKNKKMHKELQEFQHKEFIILREITMNIYLVFHKETKQLFIQKINQERQSFDDFDQTKKLYEKINELERFVKCYGYIKNKQNEIGSLIIEYMSEGTVENFILNNKNISFEDKIKISFQIIEEIYLLHSNNIIYRDLKPDNIFINQDFQIFIGDFNLTRFINESETLTKDIGSFIYASPEMINSEKYSFSTDIYSYGLVLYFIFKSEHPTDIKTKEKEISDEFIKKLIIQCLKNNPEERPTSINIIEIFIKYSFEKFIEKKSSFLLFILKENIELVQQKSISIFNSNYSDYTNEHLDQSNILYIIPILYLINDDISNDKLIDEINELISTQNIFRPLRIIGTNNKNYKQINKLIHFLTLFANKNNSFAQFYLGLIYYDDSFMSKNINKSIHYLTLSANQDNSDAQYLLGSIYSDGKHVSIDINKSIFYLTLSANQNHSYAQLYLGKLYSNNLYIPQDINKSIHYLTLSANQNNFYAQSLLGFIYYMNKLVPRDINKCIHYLTLSANQNHPDAQYLLGVIYFENDLIPRDTNKCIHYLTLSAKQNNSDAQYILGIIYYENDLVPRDISKSINYLTLSANQNHSNAQYMLGFIYYYGDYIIKDFNKSMYYLTLSINQNNSKAQFLLGLIYYTDRNGFRDYNKSLYYLQKSANQNNLEAQYCLGIFYLNNGIVSYDINKSLYYLTLSANQGFSMSQQILGLVYLKKEYQKQNISKAIYYLTVSADKDDKMAQYLLGKEYYKGRYVKQDIKKAIHYLTLSANQYYIKAQLLLGMIYSRNEFIPRNMKKAIYYLKEASSLNNQYAKNNLGVIYKNGMGVDKNISNSIVYFNEAIHLQNDDFSLFNLARIYYFGIDIEKDVQKAIKLLSKSSEKNFLPSNFFLFSIYSIEQNNSTEEIFKQIISATPVKYIDIVDGLLNNISQYLEKIFQFIIEYDLIYYKNDEMPFLLELLLKIFGIDMTKEDKKIKKSKYQQKDINKNFYDGFELKFK